MEAAEAKAYYGLATNYAALAALANTLMERESLTGDELRGLLEQHGREGGEGGLVGGLRALLEEPLCRGGWVAGWVAGWLG